MRTSALVPMLTGLTVATTARPAMAMAATAALAYHFGLLGAPLFNRVTSISTGADRPPAVGTYNLCYFLGGALGGPISTGMVPAQVAFP